MIVIIILTISLATLIYIFIVYPLLVAFTKGKRKVIIVIDKWVAKSGAFPHEPGEFERYIVIYQNSLGKPKKGKLVYCPEYVYDELEINKEYLVIPQSVKFIIIKLPSTPMNTAFNRNKSMFIV